MRSTELNNKPRRQLEVAPGLAVLVVLFNLGLVLGLAWLIWGRGSSGLQLVATPPTQTATSSPSPTATATAPPAGSDEAEPVSTAPLTLFSSEISGLTILAFSDSGYTHLFAYHPERLPFTRLTAGDWDDAAPALSPDGHQVAFASNRAGGWDIYILDLHTGEIRSVTQDSAYQFAPAWSPDGLWLAYEQYTDNNIEIYIRPVDNSFDPIRLTVDAAADTSPVWHPDGDRIAFVSERAGQADIWLAAISRIGQPDFLTNLTRDSQNAQTAPAWSPDGRTLAWVAEFEGHEGVFIAEFEGVALAPRYLAPGHHVRWSPDGEYLLVHQRTPDQNLIAAVVASSGRYLFPPLALPGRFGGLSWGLEDLPTSLPAELQSIAEITPSAPWLADLQPGTGLPERQTAITLNDLKAPYPALNQLATEPFIALRARVHQEAGWDVLGDLENAYVPLTQPLPPYRDNDWLLTGRAIALHSVLTELNWMTVVREDFSGQTYWRVYIKTARQDGSQGQPLTRRPWNFRARFSGNTTAYEQGGALVEDIPGGYWIDFTALAREYGWDRLPSLSNWRTYFPGIRYNIFAVTAGLDWERAMLEIYPPEIFLQP